jgi:hypothetical protein
MVSYFVNIPQGHHHQIATVILTYSYVVVVSFSIFPFQILCTHTCILLLVEFLFRIQDLDEYKVLTNIYHIFNLIWQDT